MSHQFTYPKVTEIRRLSREIVASPIRPSSQPAAPRSRTG
jgi:hypothetical protein